MGGKVKKAKTAQHDNRGEGKEVEKAPEGCHRHRCNDCSTWYWHKDPACNSIGMCWHLCDTCKAKPPKSDGLENLATRMEGEKEPSDLNKPLAEHEFIHEDDGNCMVGDPPTKKDIDTLGNPDAGNLLPNGEPNVPETKRVAILGSPAATFLAMAAQVIGDGPMIDLSEAINEPLLPPEGPLLELAAEPVEPEAGRVDG